MRKIKEILRLHFELQLGQRDIARAAQVSQSTVHSYIARATAAALPWPLPADWSDDRLRAALFPSPKPRRRGQDRPQPDFAHIEAQQQQHAELTLDLLWEEYRQQQPDGYCYSRFCKLYRYWRRAHAVTMHQEHRAGERMYLDWAGATISIHQPDGTVREAALFVSALGVSSYTFALAVADRTLPNFLEAHMRAFEFYGGCPALLVEDNTKTGVTRACRYEPDLNPTYQSFAEHYHVGVLPTRVGKPRDNAKVECGVGVVARWIVAALRHERFYSLADLNRRIAELLIKLNRRPYKKMPGSRASVFAAVDQPALRPLPEQAFPWSGWGKARVNIDYHIAFEQNYYSAPYKLLQREVELRWTETTLEIFHQGERVAAHPRLRGANRYSTVEAHRAPAHRAHREWPPERLVEWAEKNGPRTAALFEAILAAQPQPELGYRGCLGILRLAHKYSPERVEQSAARALAHQACRYQSVKNILQRGLDREPLEEDSPAPPPTEHDYLRGAGYFRFEPRSKQTFELRWSFSPGHSPIAAVLLLLLLGRVRLSPLPAPSPLPVPAPPFPPWTPVRSWREARYSSWLF
jgi:transposase